MPAPTVDLDIQDAWDPAPLRERWPMGIDNHFLMQRLRELPVAQTLLGASGKVLEVAAAEANHSSRLARHGLECHVLEPSEGMLSKAREHMADYGVHLHLVRGIAETLPYREAIFDRVLIDSAMDHLASPSTGLREMVRVLKPEGRLVVSFVNYGSLSVRLSRAYYRVERTMFPARRGEKRFWDTPVPLEHTFECTYRNIRALCSQYLDLDRTLGVSLLWNVPGWGELLTYTRWSRAMAVLELCDAGARRVPALADVVFMVWRPRERGGGTATRRLHLMRATPADPVYNARRREDVEWEASWDGSPQLARRNRAARPWINRMVTGDPARSWIDDAASRGPFACSVVVGASSEDVTAWLRMNAHRRVDVIRSRRARLDAVRARLGSSVRRRIRAQDLNFLELPHDRYDAVIVGDDLSCVINLELVFDEIARAVRPGGLVFVHCYVGERRQAYAPARLRLVNAALREIPARYRLGGATEIVPSDPQWTAPFRAIRSADIPTVATSRFDLRHARYTARLFPLLLHVDVPALEREAPAMLERVLAREEELRDDPIATACSAYLVLRRRT